MKIAWAAWALTALGLLTSILVQMPAFASDMRLFYEGAAAALFVQMCILLAFMLARRRSGA